MSVQFGSCNFDGRPIGPEVFRQVRPVLAPYGPDGDGWLCEDAFAVLWYAFHTTPESWRERQPHRSRSGLVFTWDGRLDNRADLIRHRLEGVSSASTDLEIVAAAYALWGDGAFARLVGDWALSIWNPQDRSVVLAKDFLGSRHLYYSVNRDQLAWCSILDPLVTMSAGPLELEEEYLAGWLGSFPAAHLTPFSGIHSVPPSSFVQFMSGKQKIQAHWEFNPTHTIRYRTDAEYEDHFRCAFAESVRQHLRSERPIIAELSGGMDSSAIVCMSDDLVATEPAVDVRIDTVSYYNDSEPNWNEEPYFSRVEARRGRAGCHIAVSTADLLLADADFETLEITPGNFHTSFDERFSAALTASNARVVLSGTGGDEVLGGVPTPIPELADLLVRARLGDFTRRLSQWCVRQRRPWYQLLAEVVRTFLPPIFERPSSNSHLLDWLQAEFVNRWRATLSGYPSRFKFFGMRPSFRANHSALQFLRRQLAFSPLRSAPPREVRYPYLDRSLLEFLYAIPREQLVRPGERRSLMRRALAGIVPPEILNRRRKAFVCRSPMAALSERLSNFIAMSENMVSSTLGVVKPDAFRTALGELHRGQEVAVVSLLRTIAVEQWLRHTMMQSSFTQTMPLKSTRNPEELEPRTTESCAKDQLASRL